MLHARPRQGNGKLAPDADWSAFPDELVDEMMVSVHMCTGGEEFDDVEMNGPSSWLPRNSKSVGWPYNRYRKNGRFKLLVTESCCRK